MGPTGTLKWTWHHPENRSRRLRAVVRAGTYQARMRLAGSPVAVPLGERSRVWAVRGMSASTKAFYANPPDGGLMRAWSRMLGPESLFIDVGANVGTYTLTAQEQGAEVIAVEPDATARAWIERNLELNGYVADVRACALAERPGRLAFTGVPGASTNRLDPNGVVMVDVETVDGLIGDREAFLKVDVEGGEEAVLRGAKRALLDRRIVAVQLEWNAAAERSSLARMLEDYGYSLHSVRENGSLAPFRPSEHDVFAVRR